MQLSNSGHPSGINGSSLILLQEYAGRSMSLNSVIMIVITNMVHFQIEDHLTFRFNHANFVLDSFLAQTVAAPRVPAGDDPRAGRLWRHLLSHEVFFKPVIYALMPDAKP